MAKKATKAAPKSGVEVTIAPVSGIKANPSNPRVLRDEKFLKLKKSIEDFPDMLNYRALVCVTDTDGKYMVLGGNMRLRALQDLGIKDAPVMFADHWTEEQRREFIIKDNVGFGEWDWDQLANEWDEGQLAEWGLDVPSMGEDDAYTKKIASPIYEPKGEKPGESELYNTQKCDELMEHINEAEGLTDAERQFLTMAAKRHVVFDYEKIAEYYAHSSEKVQDFMELSALVIIDFSQAIDGGYVQLSKELVEQYGEEYGD